MQASAQINTALQLAKSISPSMPKAIKEGLLGKAGGLLAQARSKGLTADEQTDHDHILELLGTLRPSGDLGTFSPSWGLGAKLLVAGLIAAIFIPKP